MLNKYTKNINIPMSHPSFSGHFPDQPILPGVVLLDEVVKAIEELANKSITMINVAKFLRAVSPGEQLQLSFEENANKRFCFKITNKNNEPIASGVISFSNKELP